MCLSRSIWRGNWGGFSFEIETTHRMGRETPMEGVATGAASRLRLKLGERGLSIKPFVRGNRGGFSFEIETSSYSACDNGRGCGNRGGFSFEIETIHRHASRPPAGMWQPGRLLV